jgi:plastocyanin
MVITGSSQERRAVVVLRNTYTSDRSVDQVASSKWAVDPGSLHARPGDTVRWTVDDVSSRDSAIRDVHGVFDDIDCRGKVCTATVKSTAVPGRRYEYRFFWGPDEAEGGSAPGVIID